MRLLRNRFLSKFLAVFMLLTIVESTIHATVSLALTTGPNQPEYTSYEQPGATDMVNLLTGDFTFSLPILEVPGPEGGFSVPLTYNAGIGVDQEASWVGLGWTLNVGAITRSIVQYPDDASGEVQSVTNKDLVGVRGWTSSLLGFGQAGWNTEQGHYGTISLLGILSYSYSKDGSSVGVAGLNIGSNGVSFDALQFGMALFTIATMGASASAAAAAASATGKTFSLGANLATQSAVSIGIGAALSYVSGNQTPNAPTDGYWEYSKRTSSGFLGMWEDYWIWLDQTRYEQMYGVLNLDKANLVTASPFGVLLPGKTPVAVAVQVNGVNQPLYEFGKSGNNQGAGSDVSYSIPAGTTYQDANSPVVLATDNYSVKGPGISGSIKPYRFEIGSVSLPRQMSKFHSRLATVTHLPYKVPFLYEGSNANSYYYHVGGASSVTAPNFYYGLSASTGTSNLTTNFNLNYSLNDVIFQNRMRPDVTTNKNLPMANHVEWLSNDEIINSPNGFSNGFIDYFAGSDRALFRQNFNFGSQRSFYSSSADFTNGVIPLSSANVNALIGQSVDVVVTAYDVSYDWAIGDGLTYSASMTSLPILSYNTSSSPSITVDVSSIYGVIAGRYCDIIVKAGYPKRSNSIAGYSITGVNGITYHYALPSYEYSNYTRVQNKDFPTTKYQEIKRDEPFANTWLLTAVTGSDFVDRGGVNNAPNGIIDENDWGYWVKFNYGKFSNSYQWRLPYQGTTISSDNLSQTYSTGWRQTYYLNSIETRTHVALFLKDDRLDNRGANSSAGINDGKSLALKEVELLRKADYQKLFLPVAQGGFGVPIDPSFNMSTCLKVSDFFAASGSNHPAQGNFIIQNALKRIKFTYTYDLCPGTLNSVAPTTGKLTLTRISLLGKNDVKTVPDYRFDYGNNPSYSADKWDGWGMYSSEGTSTHNTHGASTVPTDGSAWSLIRITNPLGSSINVTYERDSYSKISGYDISTASIGFSGTTAGYYVNEGSLGQLAVPNARLFSVGDVVSVSGTCNYNGYGNFPGYTQPGYGSVSGQSYSGTYTVQTVDYFANIIGLGFNFRRISYVLPSYQNLVNISDLSGTIMKSSGSKVGGNIRVSSIILTDDNKAYKTRYLYQGDNTTTSGAVAKEPEYIRTWDNPLYNIPGYPFTPVMYAKVTVLNGRLNNDNDYHTKQVYEFETPDQNMIINSGMSDLNYTQIAARTLPFGKYYNSYYKSVRNEITDNTARIGKLKSVKLFDQANNLVSTSSMFYTSQITNRNSQTGTIENNYQGVFSEGTLMYDRVVVQGGASTDNTDYDYNKMSRTTVLKYPFELIQVVNSKDGFTSISENKVWDFTTGIVTEKTEKSPQGSFIKKVTKLAHTVPAYAEMGSKALSPNNKNMLGHEAANYTYQLDASGNPIGLLSASAQTWKSDWANYRYLDTNGNYVEGSEGSPNVWRKHQSWAYKGNYADLRADGSLNFAPANEYNFDSGANNNGWQKAGEVTRYNHYSEALEGKDMNNIFSASKKDITAYQTLASASNANYFEFAYSGAEDWPASGTGLYLGGEVAKGAGSPVYKTPAGNETHTGQVALQLGAGQKGFVYKPGALQPGRTYRLSAWTNSPNGALYFNLNGGGEQTILATPSMLVNGWYQVNAQFTVPASFASLEVGVKSTSGVASFDDFRFQPLDGALTANVYDPVTGNVTFTLDNQNMFTQYEYNDRGQLIKTYSESFKYGVKLVSESKMNYRRFNTNP